MSAVVGIDLGTTNTVVATVQAGRASALGNDRGERLIPSVVAFHPNGSVLVGREAKARRLIDAQNTIYSTKRLIGRSYESEEVKKARARSAFDIREGPNQGPLVMARGESYTLPEISAFILREAKRIAEVSLKTTVDRAVITVPASFNDLQRAATKVAGHIAGVEVLRILNEPTAAALAYGYGKGNSERIAVYDFGGGTFDVTLLDLAGNVFEVLATSGDTFLGGDDIDNAIAERMAAAFLAKHRYDPRTDRAAFERLLLASEDIKIQLSTREVASVELTEIGYGQGGKALGMSFSMSHADLESITKPFIERTINVCQAALQTARIDPGGFDQVILVGGSTRIPGVRKRVAEFFAKKPLDHVSPDEVVALGAAIQASALTGAEKRRASLHLPSSAILSPDKPKKTNPGLGEIASKAIGLVAGPARKSSPNSEKVNTLPRVPVTEDEPTLQLQRSMLVPEGFGADLIEVPAPPQPPQPPQQKPSAPMARTLLSARENAERAQADEVEPTTSIQQAPIWEIPTEFRGATDFLKTVEVTDARGTPAPSPAIGHAPKGTLIQQQIRAEFPSGVPDAMDSTGAVLEPMIELGDAGGLHEARTVSPVQTQKGIPALSAAQMASMQRGAQKPVNTPQAAHSPVPPAAILAAPKPAMPAPRKEAALAPIAPTGGAAAIPSGAVLAGLGQTVPLQRAQEVPLHPVAPPPPAPHIPPPAPPAPHIPPPAQQPQPQFLAPSIPLLIDVTPLSLSVETIGGYCDVIIERNTPVPCERTRVFATASENQSVVKLNVSQGESTKFRDNTLLGQLELSELRKAGRGEVQVSVTFELDSDGILQVRAQDMKTGQSTQAKIRLGGAVPDASQVAAMRSRIEGKSIH